MFALSFPDGCCAIRQIAFAAAGDGTVMWVVQEAELHRINPQRMRIGMVPLGTGSMWDGLDGLSCFDVVARE